MRLGSILLSPAEEAARQQLDKQISDLRVSRRAVVGEVVRVQKGVGNLRGELHRMGTEGV